MKRAFVLSVLVGLFLLANAQTDTIIATYSRCAERQGGLYPDEFQDQYSVRKYYYYTFVYKDVSYAVPIDEHGTIFRDWCIVVENKKCVDTISAETLDIVIKVNNPTTRSTDIFVPDPSSPHFSGVNYAISSVELPKYISLTQRFDYDEIRAIFDKFYSDLTTNPRLSTFAYSEPYLYYSQRSTLERSVADGIIDFDEAFRQIQKDIEFRAYYDSAMYQYDIDYLTLILDDFNELYGPQTNTAIHQINHSEELSLPKKMFKNGTIYVEIPNGEKVNINGALR